MSELERIYFESRIELRNWFKSNHDSWEGLWVVFYKKHVKKECISYRDALEEAICFGWIDSLVKKLDEDRYMRKFTPRINIKQWSDLNRKIVNELIEKDLMTTAGLHKIESYVKTGEVNWEVESSESNDVGDRNTLNLMKEIFSQNEPAWINFKNLPPSHQKNYIQWIGEAKKEETKNKRILEAIEMLFDDKKLGLK